MKRWLVGCATAVIAVAGCRQVIGFNPGTLGTDLCTDPVSGHVLDCPDGGAMPCETPADCPAGDECETAACTGGVCGLVARVDGTTCSTGTCHKGQCTACPIAECAGACVDTSTDAMNCGGCGKACPDGISCTAGTCNCPDAGTVCAAACTDTTTDVQNCGMCGHACATGASCSGGTCACPAGQTVCSGKCVDTTSDGANCGSCGHDCLGGMCSASTCQPILIGNGSNFAGGVWGIAVDATSVYYTADAFEHTTGSIQKVPISGGPTTTLASGLDSPKGAAVDATYAYWVSYYGVANYDAMRVSINGGSTQGLGGAGPLVTVDGTSIYSADTSSIYKLPLTGGTAKTLVSGQATISGLAVDVNSIYWTTTLASGALMRMPLGGGTPTALVSAQSGIGSVTVDSMNVYWITGGSSGAVMSMPLGGGTPTVLAPGPMMASGLPVNGIALDATNVYWLDFYGGDVKAVSIGGGTARTVASGQKGPLNMAIDLVSIYWTNYWDGTVWRVAK